MKRSAWFSFVVASLLVVAGAAAAGAQQENGKEALRVDINKAGIEELVKLPGIGEQVAKRIVAYREENGAFEKTEELMNVRGIGEKTFLKLQPLLTLNGEDKRKK